MSGAPARGTLPRRQRRHHHHHHHQKHQKQQRAEKQQADEPEEKRPKINPIFLWASQREQRIVEVRCEDYDKRNRIKLTKTPQGWRSIPRTSSNVYATGLPLLSQEGNGTNADSKSAKSCEGKDTSKDKETLDPLQQACAKDLNGRTNGIIRENGDRKRRYDEVDRKSGLGPKDGQRNPGGADRSWKEDRRRPSSADGGGKDEEENDEAQNQRPVGKGVPSLEGCSGRRNLEELQRDKLFQPRVVLEQLRFPQLPRTNAILQRRGREGAGAEGQTADDTIDQEKPVTDNEKRRRTNKAGIQDILNMIDATASPVLAADTPSADLPVDSTKTDEVLGERLQQSKPVDDKVKDSSSALLMELAGKVQERQRTDAVSSYQNGGVHRDDDSSSDDKPESRDEKILGRYAGQEEKGSKSGPEEPRDVVVVSFKNKSNSITKSCKVAEADGGLGGRVKSRANSIPKWNSSAGNAEPLETEEERPDEPGELLSIDYSDSSKILNALRNTPGLSISITRTHTPESTKSLIVPSTRPSSKASSSSRSPDSQAECVERLFKNSIADSASTVTAFENRGSTGSPRNLPGLSIIIPSYRYRHPSSQPAANHSNSPSTKAHRVESPESTVNFPKSETYVGDSKLDRFPHEEDDERDIEEEEEDDCDSQVLEDLRRQKADLLAYETGDSDFYRRQAINGSQEGRGTPFENAKSQGGATTPHWISSSRSSEAQAKCKYQDLEHFDEQVLEELRSRGTVVSPQPSGIPCSPASRRPSSAYLERLLPSPPCSVSCSEDAKNDLTLKGILASPNRLDPRDFDRPKDLPAIRCDPATSEHHNLRTEPSKEVVEKHSSNTRKLNRVLQDRLSVPSQEVRNPGRPLSSGDISNAYFLPERAPPKRPTSAEWSVGRQKSQSTYQKSVSRSRVQGMEEACTTSSSTDKYLDPASQLRELIESSGHLIPDPLLVPRDYLPGLAAAPATEIPKLLASRPELRLPEALTRPDLLRDPDLLVISLAHLQHVLDHGEGPVSRSRQSSQRISNGTNKGSGHASAPMRNHHSHSRPKLTCKPIGTLMPAPIDLSSSRRASPYPPLLRVRSGLLKQEPEVSSTASSPDDSQLWHPLFGSQKRQQQQQQQHHHQHASWHRTTLAS